MEGVIGRRLLVNYRVAPDALSRILPPPFRPQLAGGWGVAGICLIRLRAVRPRGLPAALGIASENAAHRIAVEWDEGDAVRRGVYIPRRDTSAWLNAAVGGRLFPGIHHRAHFTVQEDAGRIAVALESADGVTQVAVEGTVTTALPPGSIFRSLAEASAFFEEGALGYSATRRPGVFDGLELRTRGWRAAPLAVAHVKSTFFENSARFPAGSAAFDCALVMRDIAHEWHARSPLRDPGVTARAG
jgi:hypothetical protein